MQPGQKRWAATGAKSTVAVFDAHALGVGVGADLRHVHRTDVNRQCAEVARCRGEQAEADFPGAGFDVIEEEYAMQPYE
jgi:hypothetical protein